GGVVVDVRQDQVRIHLDCDEKQEVDQAHWFPYSAVYSGGGHTGWYVMPEIGDPVYLYFPGSREEDGVAGSAVRRAGRERGHNKFSNPQMKIWRTPHGKEIRLGPDELVVSGKDGAIFIKLDDSEGIHIVSNKQVNISAGGNLSLSAGKKMSLSAGSELRMECKGSHIQLSGSADIKGSEVKSN
ncbi:hypothetical protein ABD76_27285, partial [Paenibacillus dendritiformis]|uniref:phage baseplate assembly protein V n=1 Tax=Paenibacillus dendritiformis TaxID=130049 RepID=UPI001F550B02